MIDDIVTQLMLAIVEPGGLLFLSSFSSVASYFPMIYLVFLYLF